MKTTIDLTFVYAATGAELDAELDSQMTAEQVIQALIDNEFIPAVSSPNRSYALHIKGKTMVGEGQNLAAAGAETSDLVYVHASQRAGGGIAVTSFRDIQIINARLDHQLFENMNRYSLFAILLYTSADPALPDFIRSNFIELHNMASQRFAFFVIETPNEKWLPLMREELQEKLGPHIERVWKLLESNQFMPVDSASVYQMAERLGVKRSQLPCIVFFTSLESKDVLIVPFAHLLGKPLSEVNQEDLLGLFRGLFDQVSAAAEERPDKRLVSLRKQLRISRNVRGKGDEAIETVIEATLNESVKTVIGVVIGLLIGNPP